MNTALTTRRASRLIAPDALHGPPTLEAHLRRYGPLSLGGGPGPRVATACWPRSNGPA